jgi:hypothetical protein
MGKPGDKCEECGEPLKEGDEVVYTEDIDRVWHVRCFDESLTPVDEWQRQPKVAKE